MQHERVGVGESVKRLLDLRARLAELIGERA
jgi:hypothetical protein